MGRMREGAGWSEGQELDPGGPWSQQSGIIQCVIRKPLTRSAQGHVRSLYDMKRSTHVPYHYTVSNYRGGSVGPWIPLLLHRKPAISLSFHPCRLEAQRQREPAPGRTGHLSLLLVMWREWAQWTFEGRSPPGVH